MIALSLLLENNEHDPYECSSASVSSSPIFWANELSSDFMVLYVWVSSWSLGRLLALLLDMVCVSDVGEMCLMCEMIQLAQIYAPWTKQSLDRLKF